MSVKDVFDAEALKAEETFKAQEIRNIPVDMLIERIREYNIAVQPIINDWVRLRASMIPSYNILVPLKDIGNEFIAVRDMNKLDVVVPDHIREIDEIFRNILDQTFTHIVQGGLHVGSDGKWILP